jgi:hypothetical protein
VLCWGDNPTGQLGDGTFQASLVPVPVKGLTDAVRIGVAFGHACAIKSDGSVVCWGQLDAMTKSNVPVAIAGLHASGGLAVGYGLTDCFLSCQGTVSCRGSNVTGKLGIGVDDGKFYDTPQPVLGISSADPAISIASGNENVCAALASGAVLCWGNEGFWQDGVNTTIVATPAVVPAVAAASQISTNLSNVCAVTTAASVVCWGDNNNGILGEAGCPNGNCLASPAGIQVQGLSGIAHVAVGDNVACAQATGGGILCWGDYPMGTQPIPVTVAGISDAVDISVGTLSTYCAVRATGGVVCWGRGTEGQLGDGLGSSSASPVAVVIP